jgi:hypothetical protein
MAWTIGTTYVFATVDRQFEDSSPVDREINRPGVDGTAFQVESWRTNTGQIFTTTATMAAGSVAAFVSGCLALQATVASVVDQFAVTRSCYVRRCIVQRFVNPDTTVLVRVIWALCPASA